MKVSDYIVEYLIANGISDVFGYPGGMVTHLMDSFAKYSEQIKAHLVYHEQGAAFAACGFAQAGGKFGVAFATSGPGATNLVTGICNAYFDSVPVLFITGQVNTYESKGGRSIRQCGFQETDIVSMVGGVTKYAAYVDNADKIRWHLDKAVYEATSGRKGGVLLDIPMDVMRSEIDIDRLPRFMSHNKNISEQRLNEYVAQIIEMLKESERPVALFGSGVKASDSVDLARSFVKKYHIPAVTSMIAADVLDDSSSGYGFIGAYGNREANFIVAKSDLILSFGSRLDIRQVGRDRSRFAPDAKIIRIDIDQSELDYKVHEEEVSICADVKDILSGLLMHVEGKHYDKWNRMCRFMREELQGIDDKEPNEYIRKISSIIPEGSIITTDVGQNQVWVSQSFRLRNSQRILYSGSNGAMGYSLPAAIGASIATKKKVYSFNGDGGIQMNMQELQIVAREGLPIKIIVFNNKALGMIRHFQEMYFDKNYTMTLEGNGYSAPNFEMIANAYALAYTKIEDCGQIPGNLFDGDKAQMVEIVMNYDTYVFPKLEYGKPNQDQAPLLAREKYELLMNDEEILKMLDKRQK